MTSSPYKTTPVRKYRMKEEKRTSEHHSNNCYRQVLMGLVGKSLAETGYLHNFQVTPLKINSY